MTAPDPYRNKVIVITGASSGFGYGAAKDFASRGSWLVLAARSANKIQELARECETLGGRAIAVPTDVSDPAAVQHLAQQAIAHYGHFDVWINNAGVGAIGRFEKIPLEDHLKIINTDLSGTVVGTYCALTHFRIQSSGILINVASFIGKVPVPNFASYAAAKYGVVGLGAAIRQELYLDKLSNIHVCTLMPMANTTQFFENAGNYTGHKAEPVGPTYDPQVTIDALVGLVAHPKDELIPGFQGNFAVFMHRVLPTAIEKSLARSTNKVQNDKNSAEETSGSLHRSSKA